MSNAVLCDYTCQTMHSQQEPSSRHFIHLSPGGTYRLTFEVTPHYTRMLTLYRGVKNVNYVFSAGSRIICHTVLHRYNNGPEFGRQEAPGRPIILKTTGLKQDSRAVL